MSGRRLPAPLGSRIDRARPVDFEFNGRSFSGFTGDSLAAALLANGVRLVGRSFKLHRPRGIFSCGIEEPNALVDVGSGAQRIPNLRATQIAISPGLSANSVNCWPSVEFDLGALNSRLARLLPAGFYYKTFKWPSWHRYEPRIRQMAGLGRGTREPDPDRYDEISAQVDVLVIGGGIAGLSAATAAARLGATTWLLTSGDAVGGKAAWRESQRVDELSAQAVRVGVRVLTRTLAFGAYDHRLICARETLTAAGARSPAGGVVRERLWKIRAHDIVLAAGAFERPMIFPDNDRPGVMLAGAADQYAHAYGVACGSNVVIAANSDSAYATADSLRAVGINVVALIDRRAANDIGARAHDLRVLTGAGIIAVQGARGVSGCTVASAEGGATRPERFACDAILSAGGFAPVVHLHSQAGGKLRWVDASAQFVPEGPAGGVVSVGACAGVFDVEQASAHAEAVGAALAQRLTAPAAPVGGMGRSLAATHLPNVFGKQFVDLQNDVAMSDIGLASQENYRSVEHLKRYTTTGMGTDQGKTSNINALVLLGEFTGREPHAVGTTKFRPPFAPISIGALVGRRVHGLYRPLKHLAAERWHVGHGALLEQFGNWVRPAAYPLGGESLPEAAAREAGAVRKSAGLLDASPLGKIDVFGDDAARFLDHMYVGTMSALRIGQARYGLLLNEHGVVVDDGIVARVAENRFWVNTTSAGAERSAAGFEEWLQCEYPGFKVLITPMTSQWGNVTVSGPRAWEWLAAAGFDPRLAPGAMTHMTMQASTWRGVALRVLRASFTGELGYEINLPQSAVSGLFAALWELAERFSGVLYGIEALEIMRTEKGFIHVGTDTDGTTLPVDIGFGRAIGRKTSNFVGRRSLLQPAALDPERFVLVGLIPTDGRTVLPVGAQIGMAPPPSLTEGRVTSSCMSPELGRPVALGLLKRGAQRIGERVRLYHLGATLEAQVVAAPFVDPSGARVHG